jgi:hypothetical protein
MSIQNLLTQVSLISTKHDEMLKKTGQNFNIFKILKMESKEVKTHSAFLAELLNPKGSHGQNDVFLQLFIEVVKEDVPKFDFSKFETSKANVKPEFYIGPTTDTGGGRIDILISSGTNIIIENKIYAGDQPFQLLRYYNFDNKAPLFYLTPWKHQEPTNESKGNLKEGEHYKRISYEIEILNWLEKCKEKVTTLNHPFLEPTITQYINLIKHLTNKTSSKKMEHEIIEKILDSELNLKSYYEILRINKYQVEKTLLEKLKTKLKAEFQNDFIDDEKCYFVVADSILKENNLKIVIDYEEEPYNGFFFGLFYINLTDKDKINYTDIKNKFVENFPGACSSDDSLAWQWFDNNNWSENEFLKIIQGKMLEDIKEKIALMLEIVKMP